MMIFWSFEVKLFVFIVWGPEIRNRTNWRSCRDVRWSKSFNSHQIKVETYGLLLVMPRISSLQKFCRDNLQSFLNWIRQFEAQVAENRIEDDRKRDALLCCCDEAAFMILSSEIANDNEFTYQDLLERTYTGTNYKRTLELKFRSLRFRKDMKINQFCSELYRVIRELK